MSSPVVDAQVHVWLPEGPGRPWPPGGAERALALHGGEPISGATLLSEMRQVGVDRAVLVPPFFEGYRNDYADLVRLFREELDFLSPPDVEAIMGGSVLRWLDWPT
jgi:predicted TIM-barrel fold metal-dependent hydrolase